MSNQICLKWNSFLNNIATSFESLWEEEGLVDVTLASDGQCLTAHKVILSASSPFFKKVFQTNPCQHPVIILQDVHFRELEALLIFIYKGEVNIEQQNLPALLKAAETLKIRGLSGGDMFAKESYKRFVDLEKSESSDGAAANKNDETPKKKLKVGGKKQSGESILEKALAPQLAQNENTGDAVPPAVGEQTFKETDAGSDPVLLRLEMKTEPLEIHVEDFQKHSGGIRRDASERLDTGQSDPMQGSGNSPAEEISGLSGLSMGISGITEDKPIVGGFGYQQLPYADLLPNPEVIATWATSRPMDHLACDLMKILFTPEERILCNVNGKMGKQQFDSNKIHLIREVLIHFSGIPADSVEWEEAWKNCVTKIDTSNRGGSSKPLVTVIPEARDTSSPFKDLPISTTVIQDEAIANDHRRSKASEDDDDDDDDGGGGNIEAPGVRRGDDDVDNDNDSPSPSPSPSPSSSSSSSSSNETPKERPLNFPSDNNPNVSQPAFPTRTTDDRANETIDDPTSTSSTSHQLKTAGPSYPPFPCPFCDRAYTSWGFRRRHIKAVHTISPMLNCKWCLQVLPSHAAWRRHVISAHNLSASDAHNGLLILEEAHMVLQIAHPTRLDTLVNIIRQSSRHADASAIGQDKANKPANDKDHD